MSRIGKSPVELVQGVTLTQKDGVVTVSGPKGIMNLTLPSGFEVSVQNNTATLNNKNQDKSAGNMHGLLRSLLFNMVTGVTKGWEKTIELVGVGYKAQGGGQEVTLTVGFTHPVKFTAPKDVTFKITDNTKITILGIDKKVVGELAAKMRSVKPPEPYKGKGIRYLGEVVRKKMGKAVKAAGTAG